MPRGSDRRARIRRQFGPEDRTRRGRVAMPQARRQGLESGTVLLDRRISGSVLGRPPARPCSYVTATASAAREKRLHRLSRSGEILDVHVQALIAEISEF